MGEQPNPWNLLQLQDAMSRHRGAKPGRRGRQERRRNPGNVLLSHQASLAVPSALEGLTAVFGMGTGVAPPRRSPGRSHDDNREDPIASRPTRFEQ